MKNTLLAFIALPLIFACNPSKEAKMDFSQLTITMDTVMVDAKDEILFLIGDLMMSELSSDKQFLYYFNPMNLTLEIVDLDKLEFVRRISYEEEGPDGVGRFPMQFQVLSGEQLFIGSFTHRGIFDQKGRRVKDLNFKIDEFIGEKVTPNYFEKTLKVHPKNPQKLISIWNDWGDAPNIFGIIDTQKKVFENLPIPAFDYLSEFRMIYADGGITRAVLGEDPRITLVNNKSILSNNIGSDVYIYDFETEKLNHMPTRHQSLPSRKSLKIPQIVESMPEFHEHNRKLGEDINFTAPVWDEENEIYYRFAYYMKNKEVDGVHQPAGAEVFLIALDKNFDLISETLLELYHKIPRRHFIKDGRIWIFENIDDEMAFVRLSVLNN